MSSPVNPAMKDLYWTWIMSEHRAGRRPTIGAAQKASGYSHMSAFLVFRVLAHYGYLCQDEGHHYHVARVCDALDETTRMTYLEPRKGVYRVAGGRPAPKPVKRPKSEPSPVTGTWRRVHCDGVVTDAHHRRLPRKEFHYRVIACARCGDATIDAGRHYCIDGWRIEADRCICPKCARNMQ